MKFDKLVNNILNEEWMDDRMSLSIIDSYRGGPTKVATLVGDEKNSETIDGVNGDGSDEFKFPGVSFDAAVECGTEIGLWQDDGEGNLVVIDSDKWDEFYNKVDPEFSGEESSEDDYLGD